MCFYMFLSNYDLSRSFSTADASGSTSQAANIQEALELDASVLLVDEDTCATNFMIRDVRMQVYAVAECFMRIQTSICGHC